MKNLVGIFSWFGYVLPFEERVKMIREAGFGATSLWWEDEEEPFPIKKENMPEIVRSLGLFIENIHVPFNDSAALWSKDEAVRARIVQNHIKWLEDCAKFNIPRMVMHLTEGEDHPEPNSQGIKSINELVEVAEELGVIIAIENTHRTDNVPFLLNSIRSSSLGFCFDTSHSQLKDKGDYSLFKDFGDRLVAVHISDNDGIKDRHWLPGHGIIDWHKLSEVFPEDYDGCYTLEAYPTEEERKNSPKEFLEKAYLRVSNLGFVSDGE